MAVRNDFKQPYDQIDALGGKVEGVMKCAVNVAEDMQVFGFCISQLYRIVAIIL